MLEGDLRLLRAEIESFEAKVLQPKVTPGRVLAFIEPFSGCF